MLLRIVTLCVLAGLSGEAFGQTSIRLSGYGPGWWCEAADLDGVYSMTHLPGMNSDEIGCEFDRGSIHVKIVASYRKDRYHPEYPDAGHWLVRFHYAKSRVNFFSAAGCSIKLALNRAETSKLLTTRYHPLYPAPGQAGVNP